MTKASILLNGFQQRHSPGLDIGRDAILCGPPRPGSEEDQPGFCSFVWAVKGRVARLTAGSSRIRGRWGWCPPHPPHPLAVSEAHDLSADINASRRNHDAYWHRHRAIQDHPSMLQGHYLLPITTYLITSGSHSCLDGESNMMTLVVSGDRSFLLDVVHLEWALLCLLSLVPWSVSHPADFDCAPCDRSWPHLRCLVHPIKHGCP